MEIKVIGQYLNITKKRLYASDSQEYLTVKFTFDTDWESLVKTAVFYQNAGSVYHVVLDSEGSCIVPHEALSNSGLLYIGVFGVSGTKRITTNLVIVDISQGSYGEGLTPPEPSEDIYAQIIAIMEEQSVSAQATLQYQETTKGYRDETAGLKSDVVSIAGNFDTNATQKTSDFNTNATNKTAGFDNNATDKTTTFNDNATDKTNTFNDNATAKTNIVDAIKDDVLGIQEEINVTAGEVSENATKAQTSETNAKTSETNAGKEADRASNNILNGVSTHNQDVTAHSSLIEDIRTVEAIARGRATGYVFDTYQDMIDWLAVTENVETLITGDNLYIRDTGVKDYWWDGLTIQELEAEAPDLTNYYTKIQTDAKLPIPIEQTAYDLLVSTGGLVAGKIYYVVPDGTLEA